MVSAGQIRVTMKQWKRLTSTFDNLVRTRKERKAAKQLGEAVSAT